MPHMRARARPPGPTPAAKKSTGKKAPAKKATAAKKAPAETAPAKKRASAKRASATKSVAKKAPATAVPTSTVVISSGDGSSRGVIPLGDVWRARQRAEFVNEVAGGVRRAAELLDVAPSQPSRWASGEARPRLDQARLLIDLDHVMSHALLVFATEELVRDWLTTPNAHLDGARPMDWIRLHGTAEVVDALRSEAAGAYA